MGDKDSTLKPLSDVGTEKSFRTCPMSARKNAESPSKILTSSKTVNHSALGVPQGEPLPEAIDSTDDTRDFDQDRAGRKLLTVRRQLLVQIKGLLVDLKSCRSYHNFSELMTKCVNLRLAYSDYHRALDKITNPDWLCELNDKICDKYNECMSFFDKLEKDYTVVPSVSNTNDNINNDECDIEPEDSASQVSGSVSRLSKVSNQSMIRRIELEKKRAELKISHELQQAKAQAQARAKAEAVRLQAEMDEAEAEALARLRVEEAALDAEEKLLACSELGSAVTGLRSSETCRSKLSSAVSCRPKTKLSKSRVSLSQPPIEPSSDAEKENCKPRANVVEPTVETQCRYSLNPAAKEFVRDSVLPTNTVSNAFNRGYNATLFAGPHVATTPSACESAMKT